MRPFAYSTAVVVLLIVAVFVGTGIKYSKPNTAIGLRVFTGIAFSPTFLLLYIAAFALTYWLTTRSA